MKPLQQQHHTSRSSSTIIFLFSNTVLLLNLITISINNIQTCLCEDDKQYSYCDTPFSCGNNSISNLKYPFWGGERDMYCGSVPDPNMELTCEEDGVPKITINEVKYHILDWDNTSQILKVARDDYWDSMCFVSNNTKNSTFVNSQFQLESNTFNFTLLYSCVRKGNNSSDGYFVDCGNFGDVFVALDLTSYSFYCTASSIIVVIPSSGGSGDSSVVYEAGTVPTTYVTDTLKEGFELRWREISYEYACGMCVYSKGVCGNDGEQGFRCFCKDGAHTSTTCNSERVSTSSSKWNRRRILIGASIAGFGVLVLCMIMVSYYLKKDTKGKKMWFWKRRNSANHNVKLFMQSYHFSAPKRYNYSELKRITNSFRNKLGQGGYGVVYKASLPNGPDVAVKVIGESKGNGEEFINEVASISRTSHVNIVSLLGFCYEANKRALIYELMPNGSLDKFIYKSGFPHPICDFDWNTMFRIVIGIAQGLEYLHQGCSSRILHLDIKPKNILLDEDFCPKISDFGLAKICQKKESIVSMLGARGTIGYMAPEIFSRAFGGVSHKSDVYSYGMLIIEIIGGRKNHDTGGSYTTELYFPEWIYKDLEQGNTPLSSLAISEEDNDMVKKITMVSLWCIQTNPSNRPSMKNVIEMLEGPLLSIPYPPKPILCSPERSTVQISSISSNNLCQTNSITSEINDSIELNEFNKNQTQM